MVVPREGIGGYVPTRTRLTANKMQSHQRSLECASEVGLQSFVHNVVTIMTHFLVPATPFSSDVAEPYFRRRDLLAEQGPTDLGIHRRRNQQQTTKPLIT